MAALCVPLGLCEAAHAPVRRARVQGLARPVHVTHRRLQSRRGLLILRASATVPPQKSQRAPVLTDGGGGGGGGQQPTGGGGADVPKQLWRGLMKRLSNLRLALAEMAMLAGLSAFGTIIEQNKVRLHELWAALRSDILGRTALNSHQARSM